MGKTSKWIRSFLTGKKDKVKEKKEKQTEKCQADRPTTTFTENPTTPISIRPTTPNLPTTPKEKKRWSFRRSSASASGPKDSNSTEVIATTAPAVQSNENEQKKNAMAVAAATVVTADAAMAAAESAVAVIQLTETTNGGAIAVEKVAVEEVAAIKIQSVFRSYLARKALCALKGLVKLQALVRGHLVRKQATATLRCIQALVTVQARARAQRIRIAEEGKPVHQRQIAQRRTALDDKFEHPYGPYEDIDRGMEENIKIVEMDLGESKGSSKSRYNYSNYPQSERAEHRFSTYYAAHHEYSKQDTSQISPAPSALTDMSPRASSGHFEEYSFTTAQSSPQFHTAVSKPDPSKIPFAFPRPDYEETMSYDYPFFPNYMANTESSRAKVRSQSAPKQRPDSFERQPSRRRASLEGRNVPRAMRMQRSSSHVGSAVQGYHYPWSVKLDKSSVSLKESECGSTSTMLTNTNYCRSLVAYDPQGKRY